MIKSYPKILPLVGKHADLVLGVRVEVTEKVDGSMFAFGKDHDGKLHFRSKGREIDENIADKLFRPAVEHVLSIESRLPRGVCYYGETLFRPNHNTLNYERVPKGHIALFGMFDWDRTAGNPYQQLADEAARLDMDAVPLLAEGEFGELKDFLALMEGVSYLGNEQMEGIVIKDYARPMEFSGMIYPLTAVKYVSERFKEKHSNNPDYVPTKNKLEEIMRAYRTEARWAKAVQHLRDDGKLTGEPKDIGLLMGELVRDMVEEEKENFKEELYQLYRKDWMRFVQRGLPEWYKQKLLEN